MPFLRQWYCPFSPALAFTCESLLRASSLRTPLLSPQPRASSRSGIVFSMIVVDLSGVIMKKGLNRTNGARKTADPRVCKVDYKIISKAPRHCRHSPMTKSSFLCMEHLNPDYLSFNPEKLYSLSYGTVRALLCPVPRLSCRC